MVEKHVHEYIMPFISTIHTFCLDYKQAARDSLCTLRVIFECVVEMPEMPEMPLFCKSNLHTSV